MRDFRKRHLPAVRPILLAILVDYTIRRGCLGPLKLVAKGARLLANWPEHRRWLQVLDGPTTGQLLAIQPRIAFRPSALYLFQGPCFVVRMRMLGAHYAFLNASCSVAGFAKVLRLDGYELWARESAGNLVTIHLHGPPHHREGDLGLELRVDGVIVFRMAFTVLSCDLVGVTDYDSSMRAGPVVYIGQVQGAAGRSELIRDATRSCEAVAPPDLLMDALAGIAQAWGIARLVGVGAVRQLAADKMSSCRHRFDYDAFWKRYHATINDERHHVIETPLHQRPVGEIVNRHRKRTLRKRRFKDALTQSVASRVVAGLSDGRDGGLRGQ